MIPVSNDKFEIKSEKSFSPLPLSKKIVSTPPCWPLKIRCFFYHTILLTSSLHLKVLSDYVKIICEFVRGTRHSVFVKTIKYTPLALFIPSNLELLRTDVEVGRRCPARAEVPAGKNLVKTVTNSFFPREGGFLFFFFFCYFYYYDFFFYPLSFVFAPACARYKSTAITGSPPVLCGARRKSYIIVLFTTFYTLVGGGGGFDKRFTSSI